MLDYKATEKLPTHPVFEGLSDDLKDPKNFKQIDSRIRLVMKSDHKHYRIKKFVECERCQAKLKKKQELMKELGFQNFTQYVEWRKIMDIMINKKDLQ